jgi:two-component system sensor histidine kinase/response regulator
MEVAFCIALDPTPRLVSVGEDVYALLGFARDEFLHGTVSLMQRIHLHDEDLAERLLATQPSAGPESMNLRVRHADGRIRCVLCEFHKSADSSGTLLLHLRLQDAKSLPRTLDDAALTANFRAMMENADEYIYFKDRHHVFTGASQALVSLCAPAEHWTDLLGVTDYDVFPEPFADLYYRMEKQVFGGLAVAREVQETLGKDGRKGWVDNRKFPIRDAAGSIVGLYGMARDITDQVQAQLALRDSEQRFRLLLEHIPSIAVQGYDAQRRVIFWNQASERLYGYSAAEALGRQLEDLIIPDAMRQDVIAATQAWMNGGPAIPAGELTLRRKDGSPAPVFSSHAMQMGRGGPEMFCLDIDLQARKQAEAELERHRLHLEELVQERTSALAQAMDRVQHSEQRFQYASEATRDGIWDRNLQTGTAWLNAAHSTMLGYAPGELDSQLRHQFFEQLHPDERDAVVAKIQESLQQPGFYELEFRLRCKDGSYKWVLSRGKTVERDAQGRPLRAVGTNIDLTARKRIEQDLRGALEAAKAATLSKSTFLANMSHEIRTPINAILGLTTLLQRRSPGAELNSSLDKIAGAGQHLLGIVDNILDLSKIEAGKLKLEDIPLRVESIVSNVVNMLYERAHGKGLELLSEVPALPSGLVGDPNRLQQALLNYVSNAIKFTDAGRVSVSVVVLEDAEDHALLRFQVSDTGMGIAPDALRRLFGSFEQADNTTTRRYGGTGLGLAITKRIAQLMQGDAGAESTPGGGSTFWFSVRLAKCKNHEPELTDLPTPLTQAEHRLWRDYAGAGQPDRAPRAVRR